MYWTSKDAFTSREYTNKLVDLIEMGAINTDFLVRELLGWMSEDDVKQFMRANDLMVAVEPDEDDEDDEE